MRRTIPWMLSAALAVAALGCGGSGSGAPEAAAPAETSPTAARTALVTLRTQFPGQGQAVKSLMDPRTNEIVVSYRGFADDENRGSVTLTPASPTATLNLVPGPYSFTAEARQVEAGDTSEDRGRLLDRVSSSGTLVVGPNTVTLTFLAGNWTFVDANGAPAPLALSSGAGSLRLDGFELRSLTDPFEQDEGQGPQSATTGPHYLEGGRYALYWGARGPTEGPERAFGDLTRVTGLYHWTSFHGREGTSNLMGGWYNLTSRRGTLDPLDPYFYGEDGGESEEAVGDRFLAIVDFEGEDGEDGEGFRDALLPDPAFTVAGTPVDPATFQPATVGAGDRITGQVAEVLIKSKARELVYPSAGAAKASTVRFSTRAAVLRAAASSARKAAVAELLGLTDTWAEHAVVCTSGDRGDWYLGDPVDLDGDETPEAWENGYLAARSEFTGGQGVRLPGNAGSCSWGITLPEGGNPGEWEDQDRNGIIDPYELWDRNGDEELDTGDLQVAHYLSYTEVFDARLYPFAAKGQAASKGTFAIANAFVQYQSFAEPAQNQYVAWAAVTFGGAPIFEGDIVDGAITGPNGYLEPPDGATTFQRNRFVATEWDPEAGRFGALVPSFQTGFLVRLGSTTLPSGNYTVALTTRTGQVATATVNLPGTVTLPVVASGTRQAAWGTDGSLTFSWVEPADTSSFDRYHLVINTYDWTQTRDVAVVHARVPKGISSITIPADQIADVEEYLPDMDEPTWVFQTRKMDGSGHNYARGISAPLPLPDPPGDR